jgi:hypothetical protein
MSITTVARYQIKPDKTLDFESGLLEISNRANEANDPLIWTTAQIVGGELGAYDIVVPHESLSEASSADNPQVLVGRLFDADRAQSLMTTISASIESVNLSIVRDRPELSYPSEAGPGEMIAAVITQAITRPGHRLAAEELMRKVAEAIPKTDDIRRFTCYQPLIGNLRELAAVRPVYDWAELDQATPVEELLNQAFGTSEGGLIFRQGMEAFESLESELARVRRDLSRELP